MGVEDEENEIKGVDFFDDAKLQNLINAYLENPPTVLYENVHFPHLPQGKVVGLVSIRPTNKITALRKNIWKYYGGAVFFAMAAYRYQKFLIWTSKTPTRRWLPKLKSMRTTISNLP